MKNFVIASLIALSAGSLIAAPSFADNHKGDKKCACGKDMKDCKGCNKKKGECECAKKGAESHDAHGADDGHGHAAPASPKH